MPPAIKSKSKDKNTGKEAQRASQKPALLVNGNSSMASSAYNPHLGTFQVLDSVLTSSVSGLHYGRLRGIDEADVNGIESDSVSNNGSCSGESEDHKEKTSNLPSKQEVIPGADNDKREKIRLKNERKHQRQKERRNQELYEKCSTYLMSRKLESLTQKLVAMGISQEHATKALMINDGKVEESVHWLFDRGEEEIEKQSVQSPGNLKIDITEELARITQMELQFKCTRQEIERAVVQAEGDVDRVEEVMKSTKSDESRMQKGQEQGDYGDPLTPSNSKFIVGIGYQNSDAERPETQPVLSPGVQPTRDDKNFNYTKPSTAESMHQMMAQPMKRPELNLEWPKPQQSFALADKRWPNTGQVTSASFTSPSPLEPSVRVEAPYLGSGNKFKNPQQQQQQQPANRESVIMMRQRPQVVSTNPIPTSGISAPPTSWQPAASIEMMKSNGFIQTHNIPSAQSLSPNMSNGFMEAHNVPSSRSLSPNNLNPNQIYQQLQYQNQKRFSNNQVDPHGTMARGNSGLWSRNTASSPPISAASSLGLFSAVGSAGTSGASSPVNWNSGGSVDYMSIDWSLDRGLSQNIRVNGGLTSSSSSSSHAYDANINRFSLNGSMGGRANNSGKGVSLENAGVGVVMETQQAASSQDWTSPFEGKDIFSLSRQYKSP